MVTRRNCQQYGIVDGGLYLISSGLATKFLPSSHKAGAKRGENFDFIVDSIVS